MEQSAVDEQSQDADKWLGVISAYENEYKTWQGRVEKIIKRYRADDEISASNPARFNILWSNVQTARPATFSRLPKPEVSRRFRDNDPVGRVASMILQRGLEFEIEHYPDYRAAMTNSVNDRFLGGRGTAWVRYEPHFKQAAPGTPEHGLMITEDADETEDTPAAQEEIDYECSPVDYVHWKDFGHTLARTWEEVSAVWRRVYMDRPGLVVRFGEELGNKIPLDTRPDEDSGKSNKSGGDDIYQACIYEIWDKASNQAIWISKSQSAVLDQVDDPLQLESFFPCPRPLYATITTESLIPVPDYAMYQDQAVELDTLAEKIEGHIKALAIKGVHDAAVPELARLFQEAGNGDLIGIKNWQAFTEKNRLGGAIDIVDLAPIVNALNASFAAVEHVKAQIYEITGLSDIIRGSSDPRETATAVAAKGQFGSMRLRAMQGDVIQYATELLQIKAQIMCSQYQDNTLVQISAAMQLSPQDQALIGPALQLIKQNPLRNFRIEVSSDSMIQMDEAQEKADRMEFMRAVPGYLQGLMQISHSAPKLVPVAVDMLKFAVTGFKVGKQLESAIDEMADQLRDQIAKQEAQPPAPPPVDPAIQIAQMQIQADGQKTQAQQAFEMQKFQAQQQAEQAALQQKAALEQTQEQGRQQYEMARLAQEGQRAREQAQLDMQVAQHAQTVQAQQAQQQNQLEAQREGLRFTNELKLEQMRALLETQAQKIEVLIARLNNAAKVEVAEIAAGGVLEAGQTRAAVDGGSFK